MQLPGALSHLTQVCLLCRILYSICLTPSRRRHCRLRDRPLYLRSLGPSSGPVCRGSVGELGSCIARRCCDYCHVDCWSVHCWIGHWVDVGHHSGVLCMFMSIRPPNQLNVMADNLQSEIAPPRIRGFLASMQQWMMGLGIMIAVRFSLC